ncbi:MAG: CoA pyrophosphatase [Candidatus Saccharibacteria bacterium]|nr:CoA pyrophosphatase [Rhodoferax sp.]
MTQLPIFDPRAVPGIATDNHLPPVAAEHWQASALLARFGSGLVWSPEFSAEPQLSMRAPVHAAVLVPLVQREQTMVLLTERTAHLSSHSGQIAFPGGKVDPEDADATAAALREAQEEIGLDARYVQVLGTLPTYTTASAYIVTPVVALVHADFTPIPNPDEVADVFEVPLAFLMNPANHRRHRVEWEGIQREWLSMPYPDPQGERFIWGATAGMLRNLYCFLSVA